jgi:hypothetical protein
VLATDVPWSLNSENRAPALKRMVAPPPPPPGIPNVFPSLGGIREYVGLPRTKFQWCGFDVFLAARRRVKSGFKAVSRSSKLRRSRELTHPCLPKMTQAF